MKKITTMILFIAITTLSFGQKSVDQVLRKYKNNDGVIAFNLTGDVLGFFEEQEGIDLESTVDEVAILLFKPGEKIKEEDHKKIDKVLDTKAYNALIDVRKGKQKVKVYGSEEGDYITQLFAMIETEEANIYFTMKGQILYEDIKNIRLNKLSSIGRNINIDVD